MGRVNDAQLLVHLSSDGDTCPDLDADSRICGKKGFTMTDAYTPGPWRVGGFGLTNSGARTVVYEGGRICTADVQAVLPKRDLWQSVCLQRDANARLIAASPDLLAVAESVVAWADQLAQELDIPMPLTEAAFIADARAAIAKAKGVA